MHLKYLIPLLLILSACEPVLNFEEPQPAGVKDMFRFKKRFQGNYLCPGDSSLLTIDETHVVQSWHLISKLSRLELDTMKGVQVKDGMIYKNGSERGYPVHFEQDSVIVHVDFSDTLFEVSSDDQRLRYFRRRYFLNKRTDGNDWGVQLLEFDKHGKLSLRSVTGGEEEMEKLKTMMPVEEIRDEDQEVVSYRVKPTRRELKTLLNSDLFVEGREFLKLK
ncbi:MAG: hypothetical protein H6585_13325 [Flavobacteriales bacterium]|nr:hypothetical protein [Flavobacteriales bacterium]MCB9449315.1 hypothetical protein [Flavobacteriales bacterium]